MAAFQGRQSAEIVQDEGPHLDTVDLNMSLVTQTLPSTGLLDKLALVLLYLKSKICLVQLIKYSMIYILNMCMSQKVVSWPFCFSKLSLNSSDPALILGDIFTHV